MSRRALARRGTAVLLSVLLASSGAAVLARPALACDTETDIGCGDAAPPEPDAPVTPTAIRNLTVALVGDHGVSLRWDAPTNAADPDDFSYLVHYTDTAGVEDQESAGSAHFFDLEEVLEGSTVTVRPYEGFVSGPVTTHVIWRKPHDINVTSTDLENHAVSVTWTNGDLAPSYVRVADFITFTDQDLVDDDNRYGSVYSSADPSGVPQLIDGTLIGGHTYDVTVSDLSCTDRSCPHAVILQDSDPIQYAEPYDQAPRQVAAAVKPGVADTATASWSGPENPDAFEPSDTYYDVTVTGPDEEPQTFTHVTTTSVDFAAEVASSCTISVTGHYTVAGSNEQVSAAGQGDCAGLAPVIPYAATNLHYSQTGVSSATISWDAPNNAATPDAFTYTVDFHDADRHSFSVDAGSNHSADISPVASDDDVTVTPHNGGVSGRRSTVSLLLAPLPSAPTAVTLTQTGGAAARATWSLGSHPRSDLTGQTVELLNGSTVLQTVPVSADATTEDLTNVPAGEPVTVRITPANKYGQGEPADSDPLVLEPDPDAVDAVVPGAVQDLVGAQNLGTRDVLLRWKAPAPDGGSKLTAYKVYEGSTLLTTVVPLSPQLLCPFFSLCSLDDVSPSLYASLTALSTSADVTRVAIGAHSYTVVPVNDVGDGAPASAPVTVSPVPAGAVPAMKLGQASPGAVRVGWSPPTDDGGTPVTSYVVTLTGSVVQTLTVSGDTLSALFTDVPAGRVRATVVAVNDVGPGRASSPSNALTVTNTVPGPVTALASSGLSITWGAPLDDGGSPVASYDVTVDDVLVDSVTSDVTSYALTALSSGTHTVQVRAVNAVGPGDDTPVSVTVAAAPVIQDPGPVPPPAVSDPAPPAPAPPVAVPPVTVPLPLSFAIGTNVIAAGQRTKLIVHGIPGEAVQVLVRGAASTSFSLLGPVRPNAAGIGFLYLSPSTTSSYEVRSSRGTTAAQSLLVKAVQSMSVSLVGRTATSRGHVAPALVGRAVTVYSYVAGGRASAACTTTTTAGGQFTCTHAFTAAGTYLTFAQTEADSYNAAGRSALRAFVV